MSAGPEDWLPGPLELDDAPQRAALAVLVTAARAAQRALVAAHMQLWEDGDDTLYRQDPDAAVCAADTVLGRVDELVRAIGRYEQAIEGRPRRTPVRRREVDAITPRPRPSTNGDGHRHGGSASPRR